MDVFYKAGQYRSAALALGLTVALLTGTGMIYASGNGTNWAYEGQSGPSHWVSLAKEYSLCKTGINQSPIDINSPVDSKLFKLDFDYSRVPLQILNNGHTIQINYGILNDDEKHRITIAGQQHPLPSAVSHNSTLSVSGEQYKLLQIHFHSPSEHKVYGDLFGMEAHFVHVNAAQLLPNISEYHHYRGSLTTPPCSEGVRWFVMKNPLQLSRNQIDKFLDVIDHNARPVQPVNSRFVLGSI